MKGLRRKINDQDKKSFCPARRDARAGACAGRSRGSLPWRCVEGKCEEREKWKGRRVGDSSAKEPGSTSSKRSSLSKDD